MTDRHAGRLRSELADRVSAAGRDYQRELAHAVDEAIDAIRSAIDRAADDRRRGERHAQARVERLADVERRCEQLAAELDTRVGAAPPATTTQHRAGAGPKLSRRR